MVTGGRYFNDYAFIKENLTAFFKSHQDSSGYVLVHGGCRGCDRLCAQATNELGVKTEEHLADWKRYGRLAGPIRNKEMLESGIDVVLAFPGGKGTNNAIKQAISMNIPVIKFDPEEEERTDNGKLNWQK